MISLKIIAQNTIDLHKLDYLIHWYISDRGLID